MAYAKGKQIVHFKQGFVEPLGSVVVIYTNGDETRHVGNWVPTLCREVDANW